jgi:arylformamidase
MPEALWRGYDQEALDAQLNLRARNPEHEEYFARWARDSEAVRAGWPEAKLNLAYGEKPDECLDYFPAQPGAPLLAFIHGGYWQALDKSDYSYFAPAFRDAGIAYASLNYSLAPEATIPEMVDQVRSAVAWLHRQAGELGFDPQRLFVAGHSAGGHLASMVMADGAGSVELPENAVRGGCSVSGIYELKPLSRSYQQPVLRLTDEAVQRCSPIRCLPSRSGPLICAVGALEPEEFQDQQRDFVSAWQEAGLPGSAMTLPGRNHFTAVDALGEPEHPLHQAVLALVRSG